MVSLQAIKQSLVDIEYGWNAGSLVVLVPGLSLLVQKMQRAQLIESLKSQNFSVEQSQSFYNSREFKKLDTIAYVHAVGSMIQLAAFIVLSTMTPYALIPAAVSLYQLYTCSSDIQRSVTFVDGKVAELS